MKKKIKLKTKYKIKRFFIKLKSPFKTVYNYFLCLKYPFWKARNVWTDKFCGYKYTLYDDIPEGWRKAFGRKLSKDLKKVLIKTNYLDKFRFSEIKEKYGNLCLYSFGAPEEVMDLLRHYELLSIGYCYRCGRPARYRTQGWIEYMCEKCFVEFEVYCHCDDKTIERDKKAFRLTEGDIPVLMEIVDGKSVKVDTGIDYKKLWGIK